MPGDDGTRPEPARWRGVEVRHFATLAAVADTGSFTDAAQQRGYVRSAVSQQIAELERLVGGRLVERRGGRSGVRLTPLGARLAERGRSIVSSFEAARADLEALRTPLPAARIAIDRILVGSVVPVLAGALRTAGAGLAMTETDADDGPARAVHDGSADLGVGAFPPPELALESALLATDPYELLIPARAVADGARTAVTVERLAAMRLVVPDACRIATDVTTRIAALGVCSGDVVTAHPAHVPALVRAGVGVGIVTRAMTWSDEAGLARLAVDHLLGTSAIAAIWHARRRSRSLPVDAFLAGLPAIRRALGAREAVEPRPQAA